MHCGRGHFNDPRARYCSICGLGMLQASLVLIEDTRPPLGVLLFSNGESHPLATDLVIGRDPASDPEVSAGRAGALIPGTEALSLSRVHAKVTLLGWDVQLTDRGSTNGTYIWNEPANQWHQLPANAPYTLQPGDRIGFGDLTALFETSIQQ